MKYLLIDANNLAIRAAFANSELQNSDGVSTGVHYGVFQSLLNLKVRYNDYQFLMVWDGKSKRRIKEAAAGVEDGLIRSGYKENRRKDEQPQELLDFYEQAPYLQKAIEQAGIPQIRLLDYEADDVIASYTMLLRDDSEIILVTTDKDYYQLLHENVSLWDGMKLKETFLNDWEKEFGISPEAHVHCGALGGDTGDNIHGIPGWGDTTSLKAIQKHGTWQAVLKNFDEQLSQMRSQFPDLNEVEFNRLQNIKTKSGKFKYPEITIDMPYTGVTLAVEDKKTKAIPKTTLMALMFAKRVALAYSLKKMDDCIEPLPEIKNEKFNEGKLIEYFDYFDIESLKNEISLLDTKEMA